MMIKLIKTSIALLLIFSLFIACEKSEKADSATPMKIDKLNAEDNTANFRSVMQKHLDAVTNKDLQSLSSTMAPDGNMQLILPQSEIIDGVDGFLDFHRDWFKDTTWTFKTKILNVDAGESMGMAITEILYEEPDRDGKPYFNRMIVSYDLKKFNGQWFIIKDHATSVEKSTDNKEE